MKENDERIIERVLDGDRNAFALLVDKYKDRVFSLVIGIVRNREVAEELSQDIFLKVFRSLGKFRRESSFSSWIYRIAYNAAVSETRKKKTYFRSFDEQLERLAVLGSDDNAVVEENENRHVLLEKALKELPPQEKLILMLYYFEEKSIEEVSKDTGLSLSNVKVRLFRLRNKLKGIMEQSARTALVY
jgi:RNA polymerase sigma-70 factor (ECF subfamily)